MDVCGAVTAGWSQFPLVGGTSDDFDALTTDLEHHTAECGCDPLDAETMILDKRLTHAADAATIRELGVLIESIGNRNDASLEFLMTQLADDVALSLTPDSEVCQAGRTAPSWRTLGLPTTVAEWRSELDDMWLQGFRDIAAQNDADTLSVPEEWTGGAS